MKKGGFDGPTGYQQKRGKGGVRDKWKVVGDCLLRVHHRPRRTMFTPLGVKAVDNSGEVQLQSVRVIWVFLRGRGLVLHRGTPETLDPQLVAIKVRNVWRYSVFPAPILAEDPSFDIPTRSG